MAHPFRGKGHLPPGGIGHELAAYDDVPAHQENLYKDHERNDGGKEDDDTVFYFKEAEPHEK